MIRSLWTAANGMEAQQMNLDVIANNLANVNTAGFKKSNIEFQEMMYDTNRAPGANSTDSSTVPTGLQVGYGAQPIATERNFTQGNLQQTGNTYDVAIQGTGFFKITLPDGTNAYTRDGSFIVNQDGQLVTNQGYLVTGVGQISPQATNVSVGSDGTITATVNGAPVKISPITISTFPNPAGLNSLGNNLYQETIASGNADDGQTPGQNGTGTIQQGYIETSNVQVVEEMVNMIQAQRAYEINSKAIQTADQMMQMADNMRQG
ncbi:MAG: flagellar basal-body rod protein FlgG [Verrucomicrobiota bacterium]